MKVASLSTFSPSGSKINCKEADLKERLGTSALKNLKPDGLFYA